MFRLLPTSLLSSLIVAACCAACCTADQPVELVQELRIVWGGPTARAYVGSITINEGTLKLARNLSMQDNSLGVVLQNDPKSIQLQQQSPTTFGGCDVEIRSGASGGLKVLLQGVGGGEPFERTINLIDVQQRSWIDVIDEAGCRIAIERQIHDYLRINDRKDRSTIFDCNSMWTPSVSGFKTGLPEGQYQLMAAWANARSHHVADIPVTVDSSGNFSPTQLEVRIPAVEGPHRLELSLARPHLMSAISGIKPLLARSIDIVAFDPKAPVPSLARWDPLLAVDSAAAVKPEGLSWLTSFTGSLTNRAWEVPESLGLPALDLSEQLKRLLPFSKAAANYGSVTKSGQIGVRTSSAMDGGLAERFAVLGPESWLSMPLSGLHANRPHRLRIQIPMDQPSSLSISVRDAAADKDLLLEPQSSIEIKEDDCLPGGGSMTHEVVFWPRSESIHLLLACASRSRTAAVGKILLESAELTSSTNPPTSATGRQVALYIDQPLLVECYGAPREKDLQNGRYYETWKTWQALAERLALELQIAGANTLVLSGLSGGNSLLPLTTVPLQYRLNKSTFFSDGRSPDQHDFIELLLLHFDRAGLKLILEADFPAADQFRQLLDGEDDIEQLDLFIGTKRMIVSGESANTTRLNPLNRKVQMALMEPLTEIVQRYHSHPSFAGLSLRLDSNSQFLYAGDRWGYNEKLVKQFASENGLAVPDDPQQLLQLFSGPARLRFISWRAQQMAAFFARLTQALQGVDRQLQFYLNVVRLSDRTPSESDFIEPEVAARNAQQLLNSYGVDIEALSSVKGLTIVQGTVLHARQLPGASEWLRSSASELPSPKSVSNPQAILITHQPRALKLAGEQDSQRGTNDETWIYPDASRQGAPAARVLLEQLWRSDPMLLGFGGWRPVWVGDARVNAVLASFKTLPAIPMSELNILPSDAPLRMRYGVDQARSFLSLINLSPFEITVYLTTAARPDSVQLAAPSQGSLDRSYGGLVLRIAAYDLMVLSADEPRELQVESADYQLPEQSLEMTAQRLQRLEALLAHAGDPGQQQVLFGMGGSFEQWSTLNRPVGWNVSTLPMTTIQRAVELPRSGSYSILMENRGAEPLSAWIQSAPIDLPETGKLTLRAWLRASAADDRPPKVRLGIVGRTTTGERYQRSVTFGGHQRDGARFLSNDWGRRPAELHVADVPVENLVELQVAIDLIGEGRIWVDDVEVVQSWLHPDERNYLRGQVLVAKQKLANSNPFVAERLLRTSWSEYLLEMNARQNPQTQMPLMTPVSEETRGDWNRTKPTLQQLRDSMRGRWNR